MATYTANISRGRIAEFYKRVVDNDPNTSCFKVILLKVAEAAGTLVDHDTLASLLSGVSDECDFTNYVRKTVNDSNLATFPAPDDTANTLTLQFPSQTWTSAGGATNNDIVMAVIVYCPDASGADSTFIPCRAFDWVNTTNGQNITASWPSGFYQST